MRRASTGRVGIGEIRMQEKARIVKIAGDIVTAMPLDIEVCIGCQNSECKTNGSLFTAINKKHFPLKVGSEVKIAAPVTKQLLQAILSVGGPVLLSVIAFLLTPFFMSGAGEGIRIAAALVFLIAGAFGMFQIRRFIKPSLPEIVAILDGAYEITES